MALQSEGHTVHTVRFNVGDQLYGAANGIAYRGDLDDLPDFYNGLFRRYGISDVVLFGDCRPVHRLAVRTAQRRGIRPHVFEEGYFRPYWITLERDGVNAFSRLPRDPAWYREVGRRLPAAGNGQPFRQSFAMRAWHDVVYHTGGMLNRLCFPRYRTHAPYSAPVEYGGYIRRGLCLKYWEAREQDTLARLANTRHPYFLLPLQLDSDAQIRDHSPFRDMRDVLEQVLQSFAGHAPGEARLVVKNHPLSPGLVDYRRITRELAQHHDVAERVDFLETGHLPTLLDKAAGLVTVNSTSGLSALVHRCPTFALSTPIYALPGLTASGTLDTFWRDPEPPDMTLFRCYRNTVIHTTQINGGFYTREGIALAVHNALGALLATQSPLERYL